MRKPRAIVCVSNDLSNDRRVDNTCTVLTELGFKVLLVGRHRRISKPLAKRIYSTFRMRLFFDRGFPFYAEFNLRLFFFLLVRRARLIVSNDLDTLLPCRMISGLKGASLVYDTHEFFTGVPELVSRPRVRAVWESIERKIFPKLKYIITVNKSIANLYAGLYNKDLIVIRNVPPCRKPVQAVDRSVLGIPGKIGVILLQGAWINRDRGGEEAVRAMAWVENAMLLVIGGGDVIDDLKALASDPRVQGKVVFKDRLPFEELCRYTSVADIGLSLDKDTNINYRFSLPNKLFDYIQAGVPVLASPLTEVRNIVETYRVGEIIKSHDPQEIAATINKMLLDPQRMETYRVNCRVAGTELCWDKEKKIAEELYSRFL